jgi:Concanavalin A-like lectin/glucanases superfamily
MSKQEHPRNRIFLGALIFGCIVASAAAQPPPPPPGPCCWPPPCACSCLTPPAHMVGWWTLDEPGPAFYDRVLGNTGTGFNTTSIPGGFNGGAVRFDGSTSFISVPDAPALDFGAGDFSIDLWLRTSVNETGVRSILDKRASGPIGYHLFLYQGRIGIQLADSTGYSNYISNLFVANGRWNHVAVTVARASHTGIQFYLNGTPGTVTGDPTSHPGSLSNTVPLTFGTRSSAFSGAFWRGDLDEIELFNRVLQPAEVAAIWSAGTSGKCKCAALKITPRAWWRFDETTGSLAIDSGGDPQGPFDGTVNGAHRNPSGRVGGDLVFNGTTDGVSVANDAPLALSFASGTTGAFSIDAWIKTTSGSASGPIVTDVGTDPLDRGFNGYTFSHTNGQLDFTVVAIDASFNLSSLEVKCTSCPTVNNGLWHLAGVTLAWGAGGSSPTATLFVDGAPVATASGSTPLVGAAGGTFRIGAQVSTNRPPNAQFFSGEIDEVELFDRALTQADFAAIFNAGAAGKCQPCNLPPRGTSVCGTRGAPACPGGEFCDFGSTCGTNDAGGSCAVRPMACSPVSAPVCGCDKITYNNACEAASHGVSVSHSGSCP